MSILHRHENKRTPIELPPAQLEQPKGQFVRFFRQDTFGGETSMRHEVMEAQLSYYRWGSAVFKLVIALFVIYLVLTAIGCLLAILLPIYGATILEQIFQNLQVYPPGSYGY